MHLVFGLAKLCCDAGHKQLINKLMSLIIGIEIHVNWSFCASKLAFCNLVLMCVLGRCGSCYSFASMAMLEARIRILSNNTLQPVFSPQDIVECSNYSQGIFPISCLLCSQPLCLRFTSLFRIIVDLLCNILLLQCRL